MAAPNGVATPSIAQITAATASTSRVGILVAEVVGNDLTLTLFVAAVVFRSAFVIAGIGLFFAGIARLVVAFARIRIRLGNGRIRRAACAASMPALTLAPCLGPKSNEPYPSKLRHTTLAGGDGAVRGEPGALV